MLSIYVGTQPEITMGFKPVLHKRSYSNPLYAVETNPGKRTVNGERAK